MHTTERGASIRRAAPVGLLVLLAACGWLLTDERVTTAEASGTWLLHGATIDQLNVPIPADVEPRLIIRPGSISGHSGCNGFGGNVSETEGEVAVGEIMQTMMGCSDELTVFERAYTDAVGRVTEIHRRGTELTLVGPGVDLRFKREPAGG
jgi:heat shock protein HslJ